jgi:hypothetical protein
MQRLLWIAALSVLATTTPGRAQDPGPPVHDGDIVIPSERTLERDAVTQPQNDFSTNDGHRGILGGEGFLRTGFRDSLPA